MAEQLEIKVGADLAQATRAFQQLHKEIDNAMKGGASSMTDFAKKYQTAQTQIATSSAKAGEAMQKTGKNFTGLTRVIQDLPFGFIAISNNLEQLIPAAAGAGLAFSALIAGLSFAQVGLQNWIRGNGDSTSAVEEHLQKIKATREALDNYVQSLGDVDRASLKGAQNAQEELVKLQTLYKATQDANVPLADRKKIVDELQVQYPKYFKNISDETILAGGAEAAYKKLATAIVQSARARAGQDELVDNQKQQLAFEKQLTESATDEYKALQNVTKARRGLTSVNTAGPEGNTGAFVRVNRLQEELNSKSQKTAEIFKQLNDLRERAKVLSEDVLKNVENNGADVLIDPTAKIKQAAKGSKPQFNFFDQFFEVAPDKNKIEKQVVDMAKIARDFAVKNQNIFGGLADILSAGTNQGAIEAGKRFWADFQRGAIVLKTQPLSAKELGLIPEIKPEDTARFLDQYRKTLEGINDQKNGIVGSDISFGEDAFKRFIANGGEVATQLQDLRKKIKAALQDIAADFGQNLTFSIAEGIGNAISGANFQNVFSSVFNIIGSFIQEVGKQMVIASAAMAALKKALKSLFANPAAGLAVGLGMIALGAIIKNSVSKVKAFAQGGLVTGPTLSLIGEGSGTSRSNPEVVAPLDKLKNLIGGAGGGMQLSISELRLSGNDLIAAIEINKRSQRGRF